jgi:hypothetical protein
VMAGRRGPRHRLLDMRTATNWVRGCMVSNSPDSKSSCLAPRGNWKRSLTLHA